jgi:hypothetical protein
MKMMAMNISNILRIVADGLFEIIVPICGMNGRTELLVDFSPSPEVRINTTLLIG